MADSNDNDVRLKAEADAHRAHGLFSFENRDESDRCRSLETTFKPTFGGRVQGGAPRPEAVFEDDIRLITQSNAYRKLSRQSMLAPSSSTMFQNRASHSEAVANTGVLLADRLGMSSASKVLIRAIAMAHDMGHPPFSHEGEAAINQRLAPFGLVWDHDVAALEALIRDENVDIHHTGLPVSLALIEGVAKRYWRFADYGGKHSTYLHSRALLPPNVNRFLSRHEEALALDKWNHAEGQIATAADWIEATVTDFQDRMLMALESEHPTQQTKQVLQDYTNSFPEAKATYALLLEQLKLDFSHNISAHRRQQFKKSIQHRVPALLRHFSDLLRDRLVSDVVTHTQQAINKLEKIDVADTTGHEHQMRGGIVNASAIRECEKLVIQPSDAMIQQLLNIKKHYNKTVYKNIREQHLDTQQLVGIVFDDLVEGRVSMPDGWADALLEINASEATPDHEKSRERVLLVSRYLTCAMSDQEVIWHMEHYHPQEFLKMRSNAAKALHPAPALQKEVSNPKSGDLLLDDLTALRDKGRLAIHIWEDGAGWVVPASSYPNVLAGHLKFNEKQEHSVSLLPSCLAGKLAILPWKVSWGSSFIAGYLLDLSQDRADRAIPIRVSHDNLASGTPQGDSWKKNIKIRRGADEIPAVRRILEKHGTREAISDLVKGTNGPSAVNCQLDGLQANMEHSLTGGDTCLPHNEIITSLSMAHVKAICIPSSCCLDSPLEQLKNAALVQLFGAMAGIVHAKNNISLPVVSYHLEMGQEGEIQLIAHNEAECRQVAIRALKTLLDLEENRAIEFRREIDWYLADELKEHLGIAVGKPLRPQITEAESQMALSLENRGREQRGHGR